LQIFVAFYFLAILLPPNDFRVGVEDCRGAGGEEERETESPSVRTDCARRENKELICGEVFAMMLQFRRLPIQLLGGSV
jgi:hypothetical protein